MSQAARFRIELADASAHPSPLRELRHAVFAEELGLTLMGGLDERDATSRHVQALADDQSLIGAARLTPDHRIERLAVRKDWRGRGAGRALLQTLLREAAMHGGNLATVLTPLSARDFFAGQGFLAEGPMSSASSASATHLQPMYRRLAGAARVQDLTAAIAMTASIVQRARRQLLIHCHSFEPDLWDSPWVLHSLRRFAVARHDKQARILLHDSTSLQQSASPLLSLAQRLPSVFQFREPLDPIDRGYPSAHVLNDQGDYYFRPIARRVEGEGAIDLRAAAGPLRDSFSRIWERAGDCSGLRTLGI